MYDPASWSDSHIYRSEDNHDFAIKEVLKSWIMIEVTALDSIGMPARMI